MLGNNKVMVKRSRSEKALINTIAGFADEIVTLICGLILPRLILTSFGSNYNGITSSISQFISCISLMKAGIGGVTRVALYKPLSQNNYEEISVIVAQTEKYMRKIAAFFVAFTLIFSIVYPIWICTDFEWLFSFSLILIISLSTFAQYYFGLTYQMVLNADQRQCITLAFNMAGTIINTISSVIIIKLGGGIHAVKLGSAFIFVLSPIVLSAYTKKRYHINTAIKGEIDLISQRWDAVGHEVANFINNNTDIMVLTIFSTLGEVSVYTVYHYVIRSIRSVVVNFITGFGAAFGNMYAKGEYKLMHKNLKIYELIVFSLVSIIYSVTFVMITPFTVLYTSGVKDVSYFRPVFGIILTLAGAFSCYRIPYETIVKAVGHYKQTRNGAFTEAIINIVVSVACVIKFGLVGVAIGTLLAAFFRTFQYAIYLGKNVLQRSIGIFLGHILVSLGISTITYCLSEFYMQPITNVGEWIVYAIITTIISIILTVIMDLLLYKDSFYEMLGKLKRIVKGRANHG